MKERYRWMGCGVVMPMLMLLLHPQLVAQKPSTALQQLGFLQEGEDLREKLGDLELVGEWIYDDLDEGFRRAEQSGKPLMVVFRCVT